MAVGVIFDVDGTLVTSGLDLREARAALLDELRRRGFDTGGMDRTTPTQLILDAALEESRRKGGLSYLELRRSAFAILDEFESRGAMTAAPLPGAREAVRGLRSKGVKLAVLTNSGRKTAYDLLRIAGVLDCFELVLTRDETGTMKPRPEGLEMAVSKLGVPKGSAFYVGDTPMDVRTAKAAGVRAVSVATGSYPAERLRAEGADYIVSGLSELAGALGV
jgi:HAD superfamily hydrolase (TIGR01509 family)